MSRVNITFERELNIGFRGHPTHKGRLVVGEIIFVEEKKQWGCFWFIDNIHTARSKIYGDDPFHALTVCLDFVSDFIRGSEADGWTIYWRKEGDHGGLVFPISEETIIARRRTDDGKQMES